MGAPDWVDVYILTMGIHWVIFQPAILVATIGYKHFLGKTTASRFGGFLGS